MLSIDARIQQAIEHELALAMAKFSAVGAAGIVMDAKTGEVLASLAQTDLTHRVNVGTVPAVMAIWRTGNGTPSSCTNTTPSVSGSTSFAGWRNA